MKQKILKILLKFGDFGYGYRISDYCTSIEEENKEEAEGLKDLAKLSDEILSVFKKEVLRKLDGLEKSEDPTFYDNQTIDIERAEERNATLSEVKELIKNLGE